VRASRTMLLCKALRILVRTVLI